ncbi:MAG: glutamate racemase [Patescibacteria group bacterium]|nr:glutamate racemase [Patescibacteria group bacterium]
MGQSIGVFDSGLGGLSVYREIKKLLPGQRIIYFADHKNAPYGTRKEKEIRNLTIRAIEFLKQKSCSPVVIACNTATTGGIDFYRRKFPNISFVGVVPPIKPAAIGSKSKKIVILSTTATSKSKYLKRLIKWFARDCKVWNFGCPELVEAVENGTVDREKTKSMLRRYLDKPLKDGADSIVFGCTHFPFLSKVIKEVSGSGIKILEPSKPVATQVRRIYQNDQRSWSKNVKILDKFYTSGNSRTISQVATKLLKRGINFQNAY